MRNRALHDALRDFAVEASALLSAELEAGAELPFELVEEPGSGATLYRYRPLTAEFLAERWPALSALASCGPAAGALGSGAAAYLRMRGDEGADADPALRAMLERLFEDASRFDFPEDRFERAYAEVEGTLYRDTMRAAVVAPLHGLRIEADRVELGDGLSLVRGDAVDAPREAVWPPRRAGDEPAEPNVLCVLERDGRSDGPLPVTRAAIRFRRLLRGLRLFKPGRLAFGPLGWTRVDEGPWQPVALGLSGVGRGDDWTLTRAEEGELLEFLDLLSRSRHGGTVAWALARFEMGCERALDTQALSDCLLALAALLDGGDDAGRASMSLRVAALCGGGEEDRRAVQRGVELAFALERFVIGGGNGEAYADAIGVESPAALVLELEEHLRALLRDVLCGYLDPDLKGRADEMLLRSDAPVEIHARDIRAEPEPVEAAPDDAVTPSADWGFDEDAASYSAPV